MSEDRSIRISQESYAKLREIQLEMSNEENSVISIKDTIEKIIYERMDGE